MKTWQVVWGLMSFGLLISIVLQYRAHDQLSTEVANLSAALAAEVRDREGDDDSLRTTLSSQESTSNRQFDKIESAAKKDATALATVATRLGAVESRVSATEKGLASLRNDVTGELKESFKQDLLKSATDQAVQEALSNGMLVDDPKFVSAVADVLASTHRGQLQGTSGADADNEVVAEMLKHDSEFIDMVRRSVMLLEAETPVASP